MDSGGRNLFKISDARRRKMPWFEVAKVLGEAEQGSLLDPTGRPWIKVCAEVSGYSANLLRRFQAALRFGEQLVQQGHVTSLAEVQRQSFSHLEIIARIYEIDPAIAVRLIKRSEADFLKLPTNHLGLLGLLAELRAGGKGAGKALPTAAGMASAARFKEKAFKLLDNKLLGFEKEKAIWPKSGLNLPNPDYFFISTAIRDQEKYAFTFAIDLIDLRGVEQTVVTKKFLLPEITKASFFDVLWIVVAGRESGFFCERLRRLGGGDNVGLIVIDESLSEVVHDEPPLGPPQPDRTRIWLSDMSDWLRQRVRERGWTMSAVRGG